MSKCRVYWGTHGCQLERGHKGPHECWCCECDDLVANHTHRDEEGGWTCVAKPPYYGSNTRFYGEDVRPGEPRVDELGSR